MCACVYVYACVCVRVCVCVYIWGKHSANIALFKQLSMIAYTEVADKCSMHVRTVQVEASSWQTRNGQTTKIMRSFLRERMIVSYPYFEELIKY